LESQQNSAGEEIKVFRYGSQFFMKEKFDRFR
jgi:hypothetical protein